MTGSDQQPQDEGEKGIQVICAGFGRTGTLSLTEAFKILGYKPYHYIDFKHHQKWYKVATSSNEKDTTASINDVIDLIVKDGYNVTLENPTCDIYTDIVQKYPNAKVILTVRDTPEKFVKSWKVLFETMIVTEQTFTLQFPSFFGYIPLFHNLKHIRQFMGTRHLGLKKGELTHGWRTNFKTEKDADDWLADQYNRHNEHVIQHVKKENLLIFNVKDGWEPLCKFLNKEIPTNPKKSSTNENEKDVVPFPHVKINNEQALTRLRKHFLIVVYGWIPSLAVLTIGAAALYCTNNKNIRNKRVH